jgi:hypothetical protein
MLLFGSRLTSNNVAIGYVKFRVVARHLCLMSGSEGMSRRVGEWIVDGEEDR